MIKKHILKNAYKVLKNPIDRKMFSKFINLFNLEDILFIGIVGSYAHGTATENSDYDIKIIYKIPNNRFIGIYNEIDSIFVLRDDSDRTDLQKEINNPNIYQIDSPEVTTILNNSLYHTIRYKRNNTLGLLLDIDGMELGHFAQQLSKSNPNMIELLYLPDGCVIYKSDSFNELIKTRRDFLSKESKNLFVNYARQQFHKMKGEKKKFRMNKEDMLIRKTPLDFIKVYEGNNEIDLKVWLDKNKLDQLFCGIVPIPHTYRKMINFTKYHTDNITIWESLSLHLSKQLQLLANIGHNKNISKNTESNTYKHNFALFYDNYSDLCFSDKYTEEEQKENKILHKTKFKKYKGIIKVTNDEIVSNEIRLSSIPKNDKLIAILAYDMNGYSTYCKEYKEYWRWDKNKNNDRFQMNLEHGQGFDSKNAYHMLRILNSYLQLLETGDLNIRQEDKREFYIDVKKGVYSYDFIEKESETLVYEINLLFEITGLKEKINQDALNKLILFIRNN